MAIACNTNDVSCNEANSAIEVLSSPVNNIKITKLTVVDLPLRYDLPIWSRRTNEELLGFSEKVSNVTLITASQAHRSLHILHMVCT